jgi:hypothetical protein
LSAGATLAPPATPPALGAGVGVTDRCGGLDGRGFGARLATLLVLRALLVLATLATATTIATTAAATTTTLGIALALRLGCLRGRRARRRTGVAYLWGRTGVTNAWAGTGRGWLVDFVAHDYSLRSGWKHTRCFRDDLAALRRWSGK